MAAAKKAAAKAPVADEAPKAAGPKVDESVAYLDPELAKLRDEEAKKLQGIEVHQPYPEPTIDDALVKAREVEAKREPKKLV